MSAYEPASKLRPSKPGEEVTLVPPNADGDWMELPDGRCRVIHAWVGEDGEPCAREDSVGAIGENDDGTWWAISFGDNKPVPVVVS